VVLTRGSVQLRDDSDAPIEEHFAETHAFIKEAISSDRIVYVHCMAGKRVRGRLEVPRIP
jgi:predicted protein tyrosine phosphatase